MSVLPNMTLIADSLGWAVLHSLWQGVVAAGIVYIVRNLTRERASEARYFTGILTLCALLCAFIGTFLYYYNTGATAMSLDLGRVETINLALPSSVDTASTNPLMRLGDFTGLIGVFWTICFAVLGMRYLSAFRLTHKLRKHGLSDLPADWQARFKALVDTSGVSPKVRAYFSEYVSSPITFGFLKPIVLVPTWFFTGMTPEQCEAVLLHELAHIRRHDYLTNILQIAIKTVFFYHPAVQFICKGLDTDREHACDDFAVMLTNNPEGLAIALGTIRLKAARDGGVFALSADGRDAPLMHRLKRLMETNNSKTGGQSLQKGTSRGLAATAMIGTALALVMTLGATVSQAHPHKQNSIETPDWDKLAGAATTSLDAWGSTVEDKITVKGKTYKATSFDYSKDGYGHDIINGKSYHPSKYKYSVYAKDGKSYVVKQKNGNRYMEIGDNWYRVDTDNFTRSFAITTPPETPTPPPATNYWTSDKVLAATEARAERASEHREAARERTEEMRERDISRIERDIAKKHADIERKLHDSPNMSHAELGRMQGEIGRIQADIGRKEADVQQKKYTKMRDRLIPLLKADGYMKTSRSKVTIKMTPTDMFINGKKLANAKEGKYCDIISEYISRKGDVKKIVFKPGYLHISQKGDGHNSSFTHNENE